MITLQPHDDTQFRLHANFHGDERFTWKKALSRLPLKYDAQAEAWLCALSKLPVVTSVLDELELVYVADRLADFLEELESRANCEASTIRDQVLAWNASRENGLSLWEHQIDGAVRMRVERVCINGNPVGVGKTPETIAAAASMPDLHPIIVVGLKTSKNLVWKPEFEKWAPEFEIVMPKKASDFQAPKPGQVVLLHFEQLSDDMPMKLHPETILVIDEIHLLQSNKAQRTVRMRTLVRRVRKVNGYVWGLTGTVLKNRPDGLWNVLTTIGRHKDLWGKVDDFRRDMGGEEQDLEIRSKPDRFGERHVIRVVRQWVYDTDRISDAVKEKLSTVLFRREKEEVMPGMPAQISKDIWITLKDKAVLQGLNQLSEWSEDIPTESLLESMLSNSMTPKIRRDMAVVLAPHALEFIKSLVEQDEAVVVVSSHVQPVQYVADQMGWKCIDGSVGNNTRVQWIREFQDEQKTEGICITDKTGGISINLNRASHMVYIDKSWTLGDLIQSAGRIHRGSQTNTCYYYYIMADHPVIHRVNSLLEWKQEMNEKTVLSVPFMPTSKAELARAGKDALQGSKPPWLRFLSGELTNAQKQCLTYWLGCS